MKKIMFNDKFGLTDAVLEGRKTMTRRLVGKRMTDDDIKAYLKGYTELANKCAPYKIGEVVAVAQSYKDLKLSYIPHIDEPDFKTITKHAPLWGNPRGMKGWNNKMFVRADVMPHQIKITDVKVERLQDISDEDCMCEGVTWDYNDFPIKTSKSYYINDYESFPSPRLAFAALVNRLKVKSTWEINPYVFTYTFVLIK